MFYLADSSFIFLMTRIWDKVFKIGLSKMSIVCFKQTMSLQIF